jgi:hypothetical protein
MNVNEHLIKMNVVISKWLKRPVTIRAMGFGLGFVWGMLVGVIVTLLIVVGV